MSVTGMYMLNSAAYDEERARRALAVLYEDRRNEFRELAAVLLPEGEAGPLPSWREFVLNFCLDVEASFRSWSGESALDVHSPQKALTILRRLGRGLPSMNRLSHLLNMCYDLSAEFREIYRRTG